MNAWQSVVVAVLVQVTAVSGIACVAMVALRRWAALRHAIGVVALALVLTSPLIALGLPEPTWLRSLRSGSPSDLASAADSRARQSEQPPSPASVEPQIGRHERMRKSVAGRDVRSAANVAASQPDRPAELTDPGSLAGIDRTTWLSWGCSAFVTAWLLGLVHFARLHLRARRQIHRMLLAASPTTVSPIVAAETRRGLGLHTLPPVLISPFAPMPMVLGCWRPQVLLPPSFVEMATPDRLRDVLIHECAHILRGDPWIHALQQLAGISCWLHPGVQLLNREISRSREEVCDNFVLRRTDSVEYAQTLFDLAQSCNAASGALSLLGLSTGRWTLEQRIAGILSPSRTVVTRTRRSTPLIVAALLGAVCLLVGGARAANPPDDTTGGSQRDPAPIAPAVAAGSFEKKIGVHGTCRNQRGTPIEGARVRVFRWTYVDPPVIVAETKTNAEGKFDFASLEIQHDPEESGGMTDLAFAATSDSHASVWHPLAMKSSGEVLLQMSDNHGTLIGSVVGADGKPLPGATVFTPCALDPVPDFLSSVTDEHGRFSIENLSTDKVAAIPLGWVLVQHPHYAIQRTKFDSVAQPLEIQMLPPAIVEGRVNDEVTGAPLANASVSAQGVKELGFGHARTDEAGRYRLLVTPDHYNIWAEMPDRIAVAAKSILAVAGKTTSDADVRMTRGGFVTGTVFDESGKPVKPIVELPPIVVPSDTLQPAAPIPVAPRYVGHYGPARPQTGAAVTSVQIRPDGTYRIRVAPGRNYIYVMGGKPAAAYVNVGDGQEVRLDLRAGEAADFDRDPL